MPYPKAVGGAVGQFSRRYGDIGQIMSISAAVKDGTGEVTTGNGYLPLRSHMGDSFTRVGEG